MALLLFPLDTVLEWELNYRHFDIRNIGGDWMVELVERASDFEIRRPEVRTPPASGRRSTRKNCESFSKSNIMLCWLAVGVPNPSCVAYVYARITMITYACSRSCSPCQSSVDYGNTKRPSMHFNYLARLCCSWLSVGKRAEFPMGEISIETKFTKNKK